MDEIQVFKPLLRERAIANVEEVLRSGWLGSGPKTKQFEKEFAKYIGCKHAIGVNSCTSALHLAMILAGVKKDSIVLTTPLTFVSTNLAIEYVGAKPWFCDVDNTGNISPETLKSALSHLDLKNVSALVVVHFAGYPADVDGLRRVLKDWSGRDIPIIEDCAHACGAKIGETRVGAASDFACFSFQAVKNMPVGDGGMLVVKDDAAAERARQLSWCGITKSTYSRTAETGEYLWEYDVPEIGYKYHMNDINAAIGLAQLEYIDEDNFIRESLMMRYKTHLKHKKLKFFSYKEDRTSSYHFYPCLVENRDKVLLALRERGIDCGVHYKLNHKYKAFSIIQEDIESQIPNAIRIESKILTLPLHLRLGFNDIDRIIENVGEVLDVSN